MRMLPATLLALAPVVCGAVPKAADWVPVRWPWADARSLDLLTGTPFNTLLLRHPSAEFTGAAKAKGFVTLAVIVPGEATGPDLAVHPDGIVFEGDFPDAPAAVPIPTIEL